MYDKRNLQLYFNDQDKFVIHKFLKKINKLVFRDGNGTGRIRVS